MARPNPQVGAWHLLGGWRQLRDRDSAAGIRWLPRRPRMPAPAWPKPAVRRVQPARWAVAAAPWSRTFASTAKVARGRTWAVAGQARRSRDETLPTRRSSNPRHGRALAQLDGCHPAGSAPVGGCTSTSTTVSIAALIASRSALNRVIAAQPAARRPLRRAPVSGKQASSRSPAAPSRRSFVSTRRQLPDKAHEGSTGRHSLPKARAVGRCSAARRTCSRGTGAARGPALPGTGAPVEGRRSRTAPGTGG